jgi:hypothetical protein
VEGLLGNFELLNSRRAIHYRVISLCLDHFKGPLFAGAFAWFATLRSSFTNPRNRDITRLSAAVPHGDVPRGLHRAQGVIPLGDRDEIRLSDIGISARKSPLRSNRRTEKSSCRGFDSPPQRLLLLH